MSLSLHAMRLISGVALADVLEERARQVQLGYGPTHDDAHADSRIAFEAAAAIMPPGHQLTDDPGGPPWIADDLPRRVRLVRGIALALAELERLDRAAAREADLAAEGRTHGADSAIDDDLVEVPFRSGYADVSREPPGIAAAGPRCRRCTLYRDQHPFVADDRFADCLEFQA